MNEIDRSRYQSKKRRKDLLQEMIDIELLAQEARRRGLEKHPEVQDAVRQILRDAMRAKIQDTVRPPGRITDDEVKAYYEAHAEDFREPERRRVSAIVLGDPPTAQDVLEKALALEDAAGWGALFFEHSLTAPKVHDPNDPPDLAGALAMVGPPGDPKGASAKVPEAVRKAVFELEKIGDIHGKLVEAQGRFYIVRMSGHTKARTRPLASADRAIRMAIFQKEQREAEDKAVAELKKQLNIKVHTDVVKSIELPGALAQYKPLWDQTGTAPSSSAAPSPSAAPPPVAPPAPDAP